MFKLIYQIQPDTLNSALNNNRYFELLLFTASIGCEYIVGGSYSNVVKIFLYFAYTVYENGYDMGCGFIWLYLSDKNKVIRILNLFL